jgi:hypothetical protein
MCDRYASYLPAEALRRTFRTVNPLPHLEPADWPVWLGEATGDPASLLHPPPAGTLRIWPMDRRANTPRNNGPESLDAVEFRNSGEACS